MKKHLKTTRIRLNSPYGKLTTPGGGEIDNGSYGNVENYSTTEKCDVIFDTENNSVKVPCHWLDFQE